MWLLPHGQDNLPAYCVPICSGSYHVNSAYSRLCASHFMNYDTWFVVLIITEKMSIFNMDINGWVGVKTA
jgi:hypothetical protein